MFRRQTKQKDKTLWTEYPEYNPINNIAERPLYDESRVSDEHRVLGKIIRDNWSLVHPLARDYILSAAIEWRKILSELSADKPLEDEEALRAAIRSEYESKIQRLQFNKDAEIARAKHEVAESFQEVLEKKDKEIMHYRMLAESVKNSYSEMESDATRDKLTVKDKKIEELEELIDTLKKQYDFQKVEAKGVQEGISRNFQHQVNELSQELFSVKEQNEKLREVLLKAKDQLVLLRDQNKALLDEKRKLRGEVEVLSKQVTEKDSKLKQVISAIEKLE